MTTTAIKLHFDKHTTAKEVLAGVDLSNKLIVLTGATSGIGIATAEALVAANADIVIGARNTDKLNSLLESLNKIDSRGNIYPFSLDLMSIDSVDSFADAVLNLNRPVDILINNAGITGQLYRNEAGIESQLMTNFIGHAVLTSRLSKNLQNSGDARVVSLSSFGHHYSEPDFDDLNFEHRPYSAWLGYGQSKTGNVLLAVQVAEKLGAKGVQAFAVHPGAIVTGLGHDMGEADLELAMERGSIPGDNDWKTPEQGAATTVWAATEPQLKGMSPLYLEDCHIAEILEEPSYKYGVMSYALSPDNADLMWAATEKLINRTLPL